MVFGDGCAYYTHDLEMPMKEYTRRHITVTLTAVLSNALSNANPPTLEELYN